MGKITPTPQGQQTKLSAPVPLTADHDLSEFDCGEPALNDWLKQRALKNESRFSRTYVVCDGNRGVAYFCISAGAVERASAPGKVRRNAPNTISISVIGRLAVSRDYAGRGLGADLLSDALRRIAVASQSIGIGAVLVCQGRCGEGLLYGLRRVHRVSSGQPHAVSDYQNGDRCL